MRDKILAAVVDAGGASIDDHTLSWKGISVDLTVRPSGLAAFAVVEPEACLDAVSLLEGNPATSWTWGLLPDGRAARRLILGPIQWTSPEQLASELDRLVEGEASGVEAVACEPLFPLIDAEATETIDGARQAAIAVVLLRSNARAWDRTRYVLAGQGLNSPDDIHLAGDSEATLARRGATDGPIVESLLRHPHISSAGLEVWAGGQRNSFTTHPTEGVRKEVTP